MMSVFSNLWRSIQRVKTNNQHLYLFIMLALLTGCGGGGGGSDSASRACENDNVRSVDTSNGCLRLISSRTIENPRYLWVLIHGDRGHGLPSDDFSQIRPDLVNPDSMVVSLVRPGYLGSNLNPSSGPDSDRDYDNYTEAVIDTLAAGISILKTHYQPEQMIVVGYSGGAALTALTASFYPDLIDTAVLVACPCNVPEWRTHRRGFNNWPRSLSPHDYVNEVSTNTPVFAIVGDGDTNTYSQLTIDYVALLQTAGVMASHEILTGETHNSIRGSNALLTYLQGLIEN